ncbi:hypothetical protein SFRURICE_013885 [Spodoptera frugiperda]|nr:hypothetical protein SFRURICE_013885 [Spodoptera frugiperda]
MFRCDSSIKIVDYHLNEKRQLVTYAIVRIRGCHHSNPSDRLSLTTARGDRGAEGRGGPRAEEQAAMSEPPLLRLAGEAGQQAEVAVVSESRLRRLARVGPPEPRSAGAVTETMLAARLLACCMLACMLHACLHAACLLACCMLACMLHACLHAACCMLACMLLACLLACCLLACMLLACLLARCMLVCMLHACVIDESFNYYGY